MSAPRLARWISTAVALVICGWLSVPSTAGPVFVTGAGAGGGPHVQVFDAATGALIFGFFAYDPTFTGGVRVAATDVNGDGVPDVITAAGPGGGPHVRVFDGAALQTGQVVELAGLFAYDPTFTGGVYIGAATGAACPASMVRSGPTCIDKYEASMWETTNPTVIAKIKAGTVTLADLQAAGAIQRGLVLNDFGPACPATGNGCVTVYAVSVAGVTPSRFLSWFQATAAARNAGKRLPTNAEWQAAALGTPDGAPCNVSTAALSLTGTAGCVSDAGAFDMVGNLYEWVADWVPLSTTCVPELFGTDDDNCLAGASLTEGPGALTRGGFFNSGEFAGVFAVSGLDLPSIATGFAFGFRAAR